MISCNDPYEPLLQRITEIGAFDVGNEGNISDIRVTFDIEKVAGISQFKILILPLETLANFSKEQAFLLPEERYRRVYLSNNEQYSVRLSEMLDVEGNPIVDNKEYVVKILMMGQQFNQLSILESNKLILSDQGIYNGYYQGALVHNIQLQDVFYTGEENRTLPMTGELYEKDETGNYQGIFTIERRTTGFRPTSTFEDVTIRFSLKTGSIDEFETSGIIAVYATTYSHCKKENTGKFGGSIKNELQLEIMGQGCLSGKFEMRLERSRPL